MKNHEGHDEGRRLWIFLAAGASRRRRKEEGILFGGCVATKEEGVKTLASGATTKNHEGHDEGRFRGELSRGLMALSIGEMKQCV
ncbi:hypothetical protein ZIOFF_028658 [Zingiber officinale]|uniref:Uncharacterized protein n=1 Tax=Zingiber officinale TaxID=94328 RepID=A0A8J5H6U1_ZINOF|nr:hypothetical protein ZIOFF_028658 [Zingiber officinale]